MEFHAGWKSMKNIDMHSQASVSKCLRLAKLLTSISKKKLYIAANAEMSLAQGALAPPEFGSSVTPIPTRESRLCPMHTTLLLAPLDWKS